MSDKFVPLLPQAAPVKEPAFASLSWKVLPQAPAASAFEPLAPASAEQPRSPEDCSKPIVTLQRKGDAVSGIRIQCGCGKIIELTCVH
ncbi:MAG TPA: hypothetical protein VMR33_22370 [Candidatus Baltobacteraceae bacterium]|jgi:hypothetical protein|nr:hypothetical protein [Candidatus Baltobacteraceae bacterium]